MRILTCFLTLIFLCAPANAGLFDDIVDKAKQTADKVMDKSIDKILGDGSDEPPPPADQPQNSTPPSHPATQSPPDPALVKSIQQHLKEQGYPVGAVDGLYGKGTRKAIRAYQQDRGLPRDGLPTPSLLTQLQATADQPADSPPSAPAGAGWPAPSLAALTLAALHYRPDVLNNDATLRSVLYDVHPETNGIMSNEFRWHKQKGRLKQQLLEEAKTAPRQFEVKPWDKNSLAGERPLELQGYDFGRSAFRVQFAKGTMGGILLEMLIPSQARLEKQYPQGVAFLPIDVDRAEQINDYFNKARRIVYPGYRLRVTGADLGSGRPLPIVDFADNRLSLYAQKKIPAGNQMKTEYRLLATATIPYDEAILAKPSAPQAFDNHQASDTAAIKSAVVDGIRLGMGQGEALAILKARGYAMEAPGQPDSLVGIRVKGRKRTEDGKGSIQVYISSMKGKVYQFVKQVQYLPNRLPAGESWDQLGQRYQDRFTGPFQAARYSGELPRGVLAFDDEARAPYLSPPKTPHAEVYISASAKHGLSAKLDMTWKALVGADW